MCMHVCAYICVQLEHMALLGSNQNYLPMMTMTSLQIFNKDDTWDNLLSFFFNYYYLFVFVSTVVRDNLFNLLFIISLCSCQLLYDPERN